MAALYQSCNEFAVLWFTIHLFIFTISFNKQLYRVMIWWVGIVKRYFRILEKVGTKTSNQLLALKNKYIFLIDI